MPRSASRDLADRFLGNRRYFQHWNRLERCKHWLSRIALLGVLIWGGYTLAGSGRGGIADYQATHGPLASVHAAWDKQCDACHQPGSGDGLLDAHGRWNTFTCQKCHAAGEHVANMKPDFKALNDNCAGCHKDHNGRDFKLTKMDDAGCTDCHRDLSSIVQSPVRPLTNIMSFVESHPQFAGLERSIYPASKSTNSPKRRFVFSHGTHLTPGMVPAPDGRSALTIKKLFETSPKSAVNYRPYADAATGVIHLDCKACHEPDGAGSYKPVKFDNHCATCHPTVVPNVVTDDGHVLPPLPIPHGLTKPALQTELQGQYAVQLIKDHPALVKLPAAARKADDPAVRNFKSDVQSATLRGMSGAISSCQYCHLDSTPNSPLARQPRWFPSARFRHQDHQAASCTSCHPGAVAKFDQFSPGPDPRTIPYDIPNIDNCRQCHAPKTATGGGIKHGCTDCHMYHHADQLGVRQRDLLSPGKPTLSVEEFLRGGGKQ